MIVDMIIPWLISRSHVLSKAYLYLSIASDLLGFPSDADPDPEDPHFFESKDPDPQKNADPRSGSWGINLRKNLLKVLLMFKPKFYSITVPLSRLMKSI